MEEFWQGTILATWLNADGYGLQRAAAIDLLGTRLTIVKSICI